MSLYEKEEQLRLAIEAADVGLWDVDIVNDILYWPARVKAMFGISADAEATMADFSACLHPDDAPEVIRAFTAAQDPVLRTVYDVEYRTIGKEDGLVRWVAAKGRALFDDAGRCTRAIGTAIDITLRKEAEAMQRDIQQRLQLIDRIERATLPLAEAEDVMQVTAQMLGEHLEATRCAYADVEPDNDQFTIRNDWHQPGVASSVGVYSLDLFGSLAASNLRAGLPLVVNDVDQELDDGNGGRMFNAIGIKAIVCAGLVKGGRLVAMMAVHQASPRQWSPGELRTITEVVDRCWVHIERARDAAELREQDRRKDEFLATLAHELRNPIAPMLYALALIKREHDPSRHAKRHEVIERQAGHLVRLIDDLLDVSRISRGLVELKREIVEVVSLLTQAVEAAEPGLQRAGHTLSTHWPSAPMAVEFDPTRLVQVVSNLLNNAARYTPDGGAIRLSASLQDMQVIIEVEDNGIGIAAEDQRKVFELFTQLSHTSRNVHGGLGIGLALVKSLVEMHGGRVKVRSPGLGQGSTFRIELPLAISTPKAEILTETGGVASRCKVLVVDDNTDGRHTLGELLEVSGYDVLCAADGLEAVRLATEWRPALVLLDLGLPLLDGYEVAARLRGDTELLGMRIVAITGWGTEYDIAKTTAAGFDAHITKPVAADTLLRVINKLMTPP